MHFQFGSKPSASGGGTGAMIFGALSILFGITILLVPELLVFLISSAFIFLGLTAFSFGFAARRFFKAVETGFERAAQPGVDIEIER